MYHKQTAWACLDSKRVKASKGFTPGLHKAGLTRVFPTGEKGGSPPPTSQKFAHSPDMKKSSPLRWLTFLLGSQAVALAVLLFWVYFFLTLVFVLQWLFLHCETLVMFRPWHDVWAITHTNTISRANQEKGGLHRPWKACPNIKLGGLILLVQNSQ